MKAVAYSKFKSPLEIVHLPDPTPVDDGVVIEVKASGLCRSDWHGWMGHDTDIKHFPHIPGHEFSGIIVDIGKDVKSFKLHDRVTVPFVCGCGNCHWCGNGNPQICDYQFQPGFTHWGSFAQFVSIHHADFNLVKIPDAIDYITAASLGCRFITSYRAIVHQGKLALGQWVSVFGCGGVGLSAIMIAKSKGAKVIAIDINDSVLKLAQNIGADSIMNPKDIKNIPGEISKITKYGTHLSLDCLGSVETSVNSILSLRKQGKHIQVGLMASEDFRPSYPTEIIISKELEIIGSHGMQAKKYPELLDMILNEKLHPSKIIGKTIPLESLPETLQNMNRFKHAGITVVNKF